MIVPVSTPEPIRPRSRSKSTFDMRAPVTDAQCNRVLPTRPIAPKMKSAAMLAMIRLLTCGWVTSAKRSESMRRKFRITRFGWPPLRAIGTCAEWHPPDHVRNEQGFAFERVKRVLRNGFVISAPLKSGESPAHAALVRSVPPASWSRATSLPGWSCPVGSGNATHRRRGRCARTGSWLRIGIVANRMESD